MGRRVGSRNRTTTEAVRRIDAFCRELVKRKRAGEYDGPCDPLEAMMLLMTDPTCENALRFQAAREVASYRYTKPKPVEVNAHGEVVPRSFEEGDPVQQMLVWDESDQLESDALH